LSENNKVKRSILRFLVVLNVLLFVAQKISVFSNQVATNSESTSFVRIIDNHSCCNRGLELFFGVQDSKPVNHCEIVETTIIPNPLSGNTRIKCLNRYNLQAIVYRSTEHSLLYKNINRSSAITNSSQLLNILQI
jgi:hypothetical protein